jgi:hypothetical protein
MDDRDTSEDVGPSRRASFGALLAELPSNARLGPQNWNNNNELAAVGGQIPIPIPKKLVQNPTQPRAVP